MPARPRRNRFRLGAAGAALTASLLAASLSYAQEPAAAAGPAAGTNAGAATQGTGTTAARGSVAPGGPVERTATQTGVESFVDSLIPGFQLTAAVNLSETYSTNSQGTSVNGATGPDWITLAGLNLGMNEHSRRVSFDATYTGLVNYYARGTQSTQFTNSLQAIGNVIAIPDYLNIIGRAFAQPVVVSNVGGVTANGVSSNGFRNSYGYSIGPDITFHLGDFADSDTNASYGAAYFTNLAGSTGFTGIPGIGGPQDTTTRSVSEKLTSGTYFSRLNWTLAGLFNETDRPQGLFSEKAGIGTLRYAVTREIAILGTGGYDAISNSTPLTKNLSGPVGMGGIGLTFGEDFVLDIQAGTKYNDFSLLGNLRYNLSATTVITGSATDTVVTPEGDMLNNLGNLTASANGQLTSANNIYSTGAAATLGGFSAQPLGSLSYNQAITRLQRINLGFSNDFERDHFNLNAFGMRMTQLSGTFIGPPLTNSYGLQGAYTHDITRLLSGTIGADYTNFQELGGNARTYMIDGQVSYSLSEETRVYFRTDYLKRDSSQALQALSPFTRSFDDVRVTIGLTHTLL
jgi:uncharacterized protein (PEP-CTERM system associated)